MPIVLFLRCMQTAGDLTATVNCNEVSMDLKAFAAADIDIAVFIAFCISRLLVCVYMCVVSSRWGLEYLSRKLPL